MKTDLSKQLLKNIIEPIVNDEDEAEKIFSDLQFLGEYKYDQYELYAPGRHFLEHFYVWIKQFDKEDRKIALDLINNHLIFISRSEFELLTRVLYWETVRRIQFDMVSKETGIERYRVNKILKSNEFKMIERSSLYIGMSDGARIDYFRRQNKAISNEQVLTSYHVDQLKCDDMITKLEAECGNGSRFRILFLIDDFCASGSTLIQMGQNQKVSGTLSQLEAKTFPQIKKVDGKDILTSPSLLDVLLSEDCEIYLCPLLATSKSVEHITSNIHLLSSKLKNLIVTPVSILNENSSINPDEHPIGSLCKKYYQRRMGDEHTGNVMYGYKSCALILGLHHNTPNNSVYLLWNRLASESDGDNPPFEPLFKRIERHRSSVN